MDFKNKNKIKRLGLHNGSFLKDFSFWLIAILIIVVTFASSVSAKDNVILTSDEKIKIELDELKAKLDSDSLFIDKKLDSLNDISDVGYMEVHGTEYVYGQQAKVWLQLLNSTKNDVNNAFCYLDIYTPTNDILIENAQMNFIEEGVYYYDLAVPSIDGVYPAIANCYYEATQVTYNPTNYTNFHGTPVTTTMSNVLLIDGNYIRWNEDTLGGVRRFNFSMEFNNITSCSGVSENFLSSLNVYTYGLFNSVPNDDVSIYIYNYTSNSWILLSNKLLEGGSFNGVSNTINTNNITTSGFYKNSTSGVRIRFEDSNLADTTDNNFDIDQLYVGCNQLANSEFQNLKGSSELHVNNPSGYSFDVVDSCGFTNVFSNECTFMDKTSIVVDNITYYEGLAYDNFTLINNNPVVSINDIYYYNTAHALGCTSIINITVTSHNNTTLYEDYTTLAGNDRNCIVGFPTLFEVGETNISYNIIYDNWLHWDTLRTNDYVESERSEIESFCYNIFAINGETPQVPLEQEAINLYNTSELIGCNRVLDDLYYYDGDYESYSLCDTTGCATPYHNLLYHEYYPEIQQNYQIIIELRDTLSILEAIGNLPESIWTYADRTLTFYGELNLSNTNITGTFTTEADKELWIFIVVFFLYLVLLIMTIIFPFVVFGLLIVGIFATIEFIQFFPDEPVIIALLFPIIAVIIGGFAILLNQSKK
jgi:hypothetical protein